MNTLNYFPAVLPRGVALCLLLGLSLAPATRADVLTVKNKTASGPVKSVLLFTPTPLPEPAAPALLVKPLLSPARELLPGGGFLVWVGRTDGNPLGSVEVKVRVPLVEDGNMLVSGGQRTLEVTLHTDADGLAKASVGAPDKPKENAGSGSPE